MASIEEALVTEMLMPGQHHVYPVLLKDRMQQGLGAMRDDCREFMRQHGLSSGLELLRDRRSYQGRWDRQSVVAAFRDVSVVDGLPKTRSGKILRKTMRGIADGRDEPVPSTIEDLAVLDALRPILRGET